MSLTRQQYIDTVAPLAVAARSEYPELFPSLAIAQAILESGNGRSELARTYNNHFGIKAGIGWTGKVVSLKTKEVYDGNDVIITDGFRVYDSVVDSFRDRNAFLKANPRYRRHGVFSAPTPDLQARALKLAGYATDPEYADKLVSIIRRNGLERYDRLPDTATSGYVEVEGTPNPVTTASVTPTDKPYVYYPHVVRPQGEPIKRGIDYRTVPIDAPSLGNRPPVTPPPIPIPTPPPRRRSWIDRLIHWLTTR
jgi:hypothetical protein